MHDTDAGLGPCPDCGKDMDEHDLRDAPATCPARAERELVPALTCPICERETDYLTRYFDRHGIYSGRACSDACARSLPGQGAMWDYEADEPIEPEDGR